MSTSDETRNAAQDALGKIKEAVGGVTGHDGLREDGRQDQVKANLKAAGEDEEGVEDALDAERPPA